MFGWSEHVGMIVTWIILTGDLDNDCDFCKYVFISEDCRIGCGPLPVTLTTSIITFLVYRGFQPKPSFVTIASWGPQPTHYQSRTVDGRNLANRLTGSSSRSLQIFTGFFSSQVVVLDFFHQQYQSRTNYCDCFSFPCFRPKISF